MPRRLAAKRNRKKRILGSLTLLGSRYPTPAGGFHPHPHRPRIQKQSGDTGPSAWLLSHPVFGLAFIKQAEGKVLHDFVVLVVHDSEERRRTALRSSLARVATGALACPNHSQEHLFSEPCQNLVTLKTLNLVALGIKGFRNPAAAAIRSVKMLNLTARIIRVFRTTDQQTSRHCNDDPVPVRQGPS